MKTVTSMGLWTRRSFTGALSASMLSLGKDRRVFASALTPAPLVGSWFAYAASSSAAGTIYVYDASGPVWSIVQTVPTVGVVHLERHPSLPVLYAVHRVASWDYLPRGAVSAYVIDAISGRLALLGSQPLSLSATLPNHAVLAKDGSHLIVAAEGGGIYNVLPIGHDGALQTAACIRKEVGWDGGSTVATAKPHHLVSHPDGVTLLAADRGTQMISSYAIDGAFLRFRRRVQTSAVVFQIAVSPCGEWVYASAADEGLIYLHRFNAVTGNISVVSQRFIVSRFGPVLMAMHPSGLLLATAEATDSRPGIAIWHVDKPNGHISARSFLARGEPSSALVFSGDTLFAASSRSGQIVQTEINCVTGAMKDHSIPASIGAATSLVSLQAEPMKI